jgi:hypothetical protein
MRPWTAVILLVLLLAGASVVRGLLSWSGVVPTQADLLKQAVALRIAYTVNGSTHYLSIDDPDELRPLLATVRECAGEWFGRPVVRNYTTVEFIFADGTVLLYEVVGSSHFRRPYGERIDLEPAFYEVIQAAVSSAEGRPIDLRSANYQPQ